MNLICHEMIKLLVNKQTMNSNSNITKENNTVQDDDDKELLLPKNGSDLVDFGCGFEKEEIDGQTYLICSVCCGQTKTATVGVFLVPSPSYKVDDV